MLFDWSFCLWLLVRLLRNFLVLSFDSRRRMLFMMDYLFLFSRLNMGFIMLNFLFFGWFVRSFLTRLGMDCLPL